MSHGKRIINAREGIERTKLYPIDQAVKFRPRAKAKFDETVEIAMNLGVDPKHADQMVRGVVNLPNGTGPHAEGRRLRPRPEGRRGQGRRRRHRRRGRTGQRGDGRQDRVRSLHRHPGHDGPGRPPGKVLGLRGLMPNPAWERSRWTSPAP